MKLNLLLFISVLTVFNSCNGQNADRQVIGGNLNSQNAEIQIGDTVPALSEAIMVIFQERAGKYWFGSRGQGAFRYDGKHLLHFTIEDGLVSNNIWGIQEDNAGNIYFDTQEGISKFDGQTFTTLTVSSSSDSEWILKPGDLWFKGNWNVNGPYRFDGKHLHHLKFPKNELEDELHANFPSMTWSPYGIYSLFKDRKGNVWFGTSNLGIYRFDGKSLSWMYEKHLTDILETGGSFGIRSMFEDEEGKYWFCNTSYRYHIDTHDSIANGRSFIRYKKEKGIGLVKAIDGKDLIYYMSITEDIKHNLWMATYADGVWQYDGKNLTRYAVKDGQKDIKLFSIYKDNIGVLWLGTHEGGAYKFNGQAFEKFRP